MLSITEAPHETRSWFPFVAFVLFPAGASWYFTNVPVGGVIIIVVAIRFNSYLKQNRQRQKTKLPPRTVKEAPILLFILLQSFCLSYLFILVVVRSLALPPKFTQQKRNYSCVTSKSWNVVHAGRMESWQLVGSL